MNIEKMKREIIERISEMQDQQLIEKIKRRLEEALPPKVLEPRKPGWGKGIFTYVSDDFNDYIPPGFEESEIFPL